MRHTLTLIVASILMIGITSSANAKPLCKEFTESLPMDGTVHNIVGTACKQPDGSWKIVSINNDDAIRYVVKRDRIYITPRRHSHHSYYFSFGTPGFRVFYPGGGRHYYRHPYYRYHPYHYRRHYYHKRHHYHRRSYDRQRHHDRRRRHWR